MECVFGLVGDGFAIVAADSSAVNSILVHKTNEDKIMILDSHKLLGASGEGGDRVQFTEYIQKNVHLYQFRNGIPLSTAATANISKWGRLLRCSPAAWVCLALCPFSKKAMVSKTELELTLWFDDKEFQVQRNESLLKRFESEGIVKQVFPLHGMMMK